MSRELTNSLLTKAKSLLGVPYRFGGSDPKRYLDCSAYVQLVYREVGIELGRTSFAQFQAGKPAAVDELKPGDLVFFRSYGRGPSHVGIYLGNGEFIHASAPKVQISRMDSPNRKKSFYGARRVLP